MPSLSAPLRAIRHSLRFKLTAAFLLVAAVGVIVVSLLANRAAADAFRHFLDQDMAAQWTEFQGELARYYAEQGHWDGVEALVVAAGPEPGQGGGSLVLWDAAGQIVAAAGGRRSRPPTLAEADASLPIIVHGQQVGTLLVNQPGGSGGGAWQQFLSQVNSAIRWGALVAVLLALFLGALLARQLTEPLRRLTEGTRRVAAGDLGQQVDADATGEIGELAAGFNQMSLALAASEQQRQQMLADVAHELRTPLSITRGHIEAMLDGVFEMTPDNLALIHEETLLLGRLVEDLRTLSLAEAGQLSLQTRRVNLNELAGQSVAAFEALAEADGVLLQAELPAHTFEVMGDPNRIRQVLGNLLSNALRHVQTPGNETPQVLLSLVGAQAAVQLRIADNGPGLTAEARAHVFDRFWRADGARSRDQGGSGLGLAICRAIVEAQGGHIWAESSPGEGSIFVVELPVAPSPPR